MKYILLAFLLCSCAHNRNACINSSIAVGYTLEQANQGCGMTPLPRGENDWRHGR